MALRTTCMKKSISRLSKYGQVVSM